MARFESIRGLTEKSVYNIPLSTSIHLALRHYELVYVFGIIQLKTYFLLNPFYLSVYDRTHTQPDDGTS